MIITNIKFIVPGATRVLIETSDIGPMERDYPTTGWETEFIEAWLDAGNTIEPYSPPADWTGFRHWLTSEPEGQEIMGKILQDSTQDARVAVYNGWLMDQLRTNDYEGVVQFSNAINDIFAFSPTQKDNVNAAALRFNLPGPIFS